MSRRAGRLVVGLVVALGAVVTLSVRPAAACTCWRYGVEAPADRPLASGLAEADGAVVATYVGSGTFAVERAVKGPIGTTVQVGFPTNSAACGFVPTPGGRTGMLLSRNEADQWHTSSCSLVDPDVLLASADRAPSTSRLAENLLAAAVLGGVTCLAVARTEARTRTTRLIEPGREEGLRRRTGRSRRCAGRWGC